MLRIAKVLTEDQKSKWKSYRASQAEKHKAGMAKYRGEHAQRMQESLSLSDEQTSKIKSIDKEFGDRFRALRSDSTLAREDLQKKARAASGRVSIQNKIRFDRGAVQKMGNAESRSQEKKILDLS